MYFYVCVTGVLCACLRACVFVGGGVGVRYFFTNTCRPRYFFCLIRVVLFFRHSSVNICTIN